MEKTKTEALGKRTIYSGLVSTQILYASLTQSVRVICLDEVESFHILFDKRLNVDGTNSLICT